MSRKSPRLPVEGEVFFFTSPFIEQAVTLKIPRRRIMSEIEILRQQPSFQFGFEPLNMGTLLVAHTAEPL